MAEFVGYAYFTEIQRMIWDIQRMGHSTRSAHPHQPGRPPGHLTTWAAATPAIRSSSGHPKEAFDMAGAALDLSERLQTPIFVLSDLDLGMNLWIGGDFQDILEAPLDRGKVLSAEDVAQLET